MKMPVGSRKSSNSKSSSSKPASSRSPRRIPEERILILSDSTGDTAETFVRAILAQFGKAQAQLKRVPNIQNETDLLKAVTSVQSPYLVTYTFASENLRKKAWSLIRENGLTGLDLFYPAVEVFSTFLKRDPSQEAGLLHSASADYYFDRVDAIEFTVKHDDGMRLEDLDQADVILIGVSRSSKTPTSIYLAHKGLRVANVPMVPGIPTPPELIHAAQARIPIVCLTIREQDLERIRKSRYQNLAPTHRIPKALHQDAHYIDREKIRVELLETQKLARQFGWPVIDVTDKAIEETASEILLYITEQRS